MDQFPIRQTLELGKSISTAHFSKIVNFGFVLYKYCKMRKINQYCKSVINESLRAFFPARTSRHFCNKDEFQICEGIKLPLSFVFSTKRGISTNKYCSARLKRVT